MKDMITSLQNLGYTEENIAFVSENQLQDLLKGRISRQDKDLYRIITAKGEIKAEITGNLRYTAADTFDLPVVGDWVTILEYEGHHMIRDILPRKSFLARRSVTKTKNSQVMAANIDTALIVQSLDNDYNLNRIDRYISIAHSGRVDPVLIFNKTDLLDKQSLHEVCTSVQKRFDNTEVFFTSVLKSTGFNTLQEIFKPQHTYCLLGSSGAGKSSIINTLSGKDLLKTNTISESTSKGRHTTTYRELYVLDNGSILIDTPGMRELGITESNEGINSAFSEITNLSEACRYDNCTHEEEPGCAVLEAVSDGSLDKMVYRNFLKLKREAKHYESTVADKRKADKEFGKMVKKAMKHKKGNKY